MDIEQVIGQAEAENTLLSLAQSSTTLAEILVKLSSNEDINVREAVAQHKNTPSSTLKQMVKRKPGEILPAGVFRAIARNVNTTAEILDKLIQACKCYSVYQAVLENPQTSTCTLEKIAMDKQMLSDKETCRLLRQHPNVTPTIVHIAGFFSGSQDTPHHILEKLANHQNTYISNLVFEHSNMSTELLHKLSCDRRENIRQAVAEHSKTATITINNLVKDSSENVRQKIALRQDISERIMIILAKDSSGKVRSALLTNPDLSYDIFHILLEGSYNNHCPKITQDDNIQIRAKVAGHSRVSFEILDKLTTDKNEIVRAEVASNKKNIYPEILEYLVKDPSPKVRSAIVRNPTYQTILERLQADEDWGVRKAVARNPSASETILDKLHTDESDYVRKAVAINPNTSETTLDKLKLYEDPHILIGIARNPNTSISTLTELSNFSRESFGCALRMIRFGAKGNLKKKQIEIQQAQDENTVPEVLTKLANSQSKIVRKYVASNPNTSVEALEKLCREFTEEIMTNSIFNLLRLENPASPFIQFALALSSTTPEKTLIELAHSNLRKLAINNKSFIPEEKNFPIVVAIAKNKSLSPKFREQLLQQIDGFFGNTGYTSSPFFDDPLFW